MQRNLEITYNGQSMTVPILDEDVSDQEAIDDFFQYVSVNVE